MNLTFLGTGAADWNLPLDHVKISKSHRRFCSAIVDGTLLIDPGPHIFDFAEKNGTPEMFDGLKYVIITHSHADHLCTATVEELSRRTGCKFLGSDAVADKLRATSRAFEHGEIDFTPIDYETHYRLGSYRILPLRSNHATENPYEVTLNYVVETEENGEIKRFFYGLDSAWINLHTWLIIRSMRMQAMILECTIGDVDGDFRVFEHTSIPMLEIMLSSMRANHYCAEDAKIYVSHMARGLHTSHDELVERLKPLNVTPAYDGMKIKI
jgi:phosphoribosyl 1,2-cyclic phosphodiesterase